MKTGPHDAPAEPLVAHPAVALDPHSDPHALAKHHRAMVEAERALVSAAKNVAELLLKHVEHGPLPAGVAPNDVNEKLHALDMALYNAHMLIDPTEERMPFVRIPEADQAGGSPEPLTSQTNQPPMPPWPPHYHGEPPSGPDMRPPGLARPVPEPPLSTAPEPPHRGASTVDDTMGSKPKAGAAADDKPKAKK